MKSRGIWWDTWLGSATLKWVLSQSIAKYQEQMGPTNGARAVELWTFTRSLFIPTILPWETWPHKVSHNIYWYHFERCCGLYGYDYETTSACLLWARQQVTSVTICIEFVSSAIIISQNFNRTHRSSLQDRHPCFTLLLKVWVNSMTIHIISIGLFMGTVYVRDFPFALSASLGWVEYTRPFHHTAA